MPVSKSFRSPQTVRDFGDLLHGRGLSACHEVVRLGQRDPVSLTCRHGSQPFPFLETSQHITALDGYGPIADPFPLLEPLRVVPQVWGFWARPCRMAW